MYYLLLDKKYLKVFVYPSVGDLSEKNKRVAFLKLLLQNHFSKT